MGIVLLRCALSRVVWDTGSKVMLVYYCCTYVAFRVH